jgi:hypothetical protein
MRRTILMVSTMAIAVVLAMGIASADPVNGKNADVFTISCTNGQTYQVVTTSGIPAHLVGSTGNIIPVEFTFKATDPDTGEVLFSETESIGQGDRVGLQGDLITCTTAPEVIEDPETGELVEFVISVEALLTPLG